MPRHGEGYIHSPRSKEICSSEKDLTEDCPSRRRSALPVRNALSHVIFGCSLRRKESRVEPAQAIPKRTIRPQLQASALPQSKTTFTSPCNAEETTSLSLDPTQTSLPQLDPAYADFIYDVLVFTKKGNKIRRLLVLDFQTDVNIISEDVYQSLDIKGSSCDPPVVLQVAGRGQVTPSRSVDVKWRLWADSTVYNTKFYVVEGCRFDLLLGRPWVIHYQLSRKDPAVGLRIQSSYQDS